MVGGVEVREGGLFQVGSTSPPGGGGWVVPQIELFAGLDLRRLDPFFQSDQHLVLQGYLAHKKPPPPLGPL